MRNDKWERKNPKWETRMRNENNKWQMRNEHEKWEIRNENENDKWEDNK